MTPIIRDARQAECCGCEREAMCAPVKLSGTKWFWFCAECARAIGCTWAAVCRADLALSEQTRASAGGQLKGTGAAK